MFDDPAKTAEPIEMPFGLWTLVGPRKHALYGVHTGATWRIPLIRRPCAAAMRPSFWQITLPLVTIITAVYTEDRDVETFRRFGKCKSALSYDENRRKCSRENGTDEEGAEDVEGDKERISDV